uniref:Uncharacterized protein n=1 Tax=Symphyocladiella dendroidea TaxID=2506487 RepID=A0A1Z1M764_9FLOR|nr:hypothetical protein [Symphyocladiella dendroidea]ARW61856.1 hypothetical protein [Symphyocladiella dendroidea]
MQHNLSIFLNQINGDWCLQENFYLLFYKQQKQYKERVSFLKNPPDSKFHIFNFLIKNVNSHKSLFKLEKVTTNGITIIGINRNRQVNYKEYIYLINNNFMISLIIIKNLHKKKYLGVKISSYIRLMQ